MIAFVITTSIVVWFVLQGRASRQPVWERRWTRLDEALSPVVRYIRADIRAVRNQLRSRKRVDWDEELRRLEDGEAGPG